MPRAFILLFTLSFVLIVSSTSPRGTAIDVFFDPRGVYVLSLDPSSGPALRRDVHALRSQPPATHALRAGPAAADRAVLPSDLTAAAYALRVRLA